MTSCWSADPLQRIPMKEIHCRLLEMCFHNESQRHTRYGAIEIGGMEIEAYDQIESSRIDSDSKLYLEILEDL